MACSGTIGSVLNYGSSFKNEYSSARGLQAQYDALQAQKQAQMQAYSSYQQYVHTTTAASTGDMIIFEPALATPVRPKCETNVEWLNRRVKEMRVCL